MSGVSDVLLMITGERLGRPVRLLARKLRLGPSRLRQSKALFSRQSKITGHAVIALHVNAARGISKTHGADNLLAL